MWIASTRCSTAWELDTPTLHWQRRFGKKTKSSPKSTCAGSPPPRPLPERGGLPAGEGRRVGGRGRRAAARLAPPRPRPTRLPAALPVNRLDPDGSPHATGHHDRARRRTVVGGVVPAKRARGSVLAHRR